MSVINNNVISNNAYAGQYFDTIIASQLPGDLLKRLDLTAEVTSDPYFLKTVLRLTSKNHGIDLTIDLEPLRTGSREACLKVPELIITHLCAVR
jgi:hypothetical protein